MERRSTSSREQYLRRRTEQERQEFLEHEAAAGLDNLGEGIVYSTIMALPAPTAPTRPGIPIMHELPRRVDGLHPRLAAL